jgi:hypothetical protein
MYNTFASNAIEMTIYGLEDASLLPGNPDQGLAGLKASLHLEY